MRRRVTFPIDQRKVPSRQPTTKPQMRRSVIKRVALAAALASLALAAGLALGRSSNERATGAASDMVQALDCDRRADALADALARLERATGAVDNPDNWVPVRPGEADEWEPVRAAMGEWTSVAAAMTGYADCGGRDDLLPHWAWPDMHQSLLDMWLACQDAKGSDGPAAFLSGAIFGVAAADPTCGPAPYWPKALTVALLPDA